NTLTAIGQLASTYRHSQRFTEAEELQVKVLEARRRVLGEEHPHNFTTMHNLATIYYCQGRFLVAEELMGMKSESKKLILGEDNPNTQLSSRWLADIKDKLK
ncbi:hypothetical protein BZA77DRAFT_373883, partial [Pyronema omphalodes]